MEDGGPNDLLPEDPSPGLGEQQTEDAQGTQDEERGPKRPRTANALNVGLVNIR